MPNHQNKQALTMPEQSKRAIFVFILMALFLCFEMGLQVSPAVMTKDLGIDLHLNSFDLGIMSGIYFVTYSIMQIPSGLMYDRLNFVKVVGTAILICGIGAGLFALSQSLLSGAIARMLMGLGSAFAFLSVLTTAARYFRPQYFAMLAGIAQLLAALGAIGGELPIAWLNKNIGWRHSFIFFMIFSFILVVTIVFAFRGMDKNAQLPEESEPIRQSLKAILKNTQTWLIGCYALLNWAPMTAFASLWGVPFLMTKFSLSLTEAASLMSLVWLGVGLSSPIIGALSDFISKRKIILILTALTGALSFLILILAHHLSVPSLAILLFTAGIGSSGQVLSFAVVKDFTSKARTSAAIGFNNMAVVASGIIMQPLIGRLVQMNNTSTTPHEYSLSAFEISMWLLPLCHILCVLIALFLIREHYKKS